MVRMKRLALIGLVAGLPVLQGCATQAPPPPAPTAPPPTLAPAPAPPPVAAPAPRPAPPAGGGMRMPTLQDTPQEAAAKATVEAWGALLDQGKINEAINLYVSPYFVDHSELGRFMAKTRHLGFAKTEAVFHMMVAQPGPKMVQKITADDNMVTVRGRLGQDIFRVQNGKITDHWDTLGGFTGGSAGGGGPGQ